ncbi:DUF262 domain-containing protein [Clostridium botulinum]|uniref:DUF262 domain-containing protein n=1 Tax=Clostridium botulinum TaxID=1491 RepID=A0A846J6U2_CLOBO|nr:DUF262 domain-containing protein [Clostridium botulinum]ACA54260.1 conserved hypothetical protein [Clostridium botulinum A3 str. Loch Maree]NFH64892.1 DUF262 domain-containing protein [Clostridium botulinum]NFJ08910.1 DUF262 domain-containing protein [Clostridium botulinum]NFK16178.1 DUF262 domain-containing protein [Clostridium botulinum]NFM92521.1 DUF262 domain-containing protein [Clostridium botulinum]
MGEEKLLEELQRERKNIKTDSYSMSIGEIINLYNDGELKLNPAFQRLYRWDDEQKTNFIESILIGIPIPEIFVAQKQDGKWDIVDGVQRISTLLQLTKNLKDREPLVLQQTTYLPSLEGFTWDTLPLEVKRILRRSKMGINIILTENSIQSQYELFKRLNTGGLHLEDQEIRNCLLIMIDENFYDAINKLKNYANFKKCLTISADRYKEEYHMELIIRYLIAKMNMVNYDDYNVSHNKLSEFIDKEITKIIDSSSFDLDYEIEVFMKTFDFLEKNLGENAFKKYYVNKGKFEGAFSNASYELIASGVAKNIEKLSIKSKEEFEKDVIEMYKDERFNNAAKRGVKAITRFKELTKFSEEYFTNEI